MISLTLKNEIIQSYLKGKPQRTIAMELGISPTTVNKYVQEYKEAQRKAALETDEKIKAEILKNAIDAPKMKKPSSRKRRKFTDEISQRLNEILSDEQKKKEILGNWDKQKLNAAMIHRILIDEGFDIGLTTIKREISRRCRRRKECFIKQEYPFGQRYEFDFGEVKLVIGGQLRKFNLAVMAAPASGFRWAFLYQTQKFQTFLEAHQRFFEMTGGTPDEIVYDNMRNVVSSFKNKEKTINRELIKFANYYGFAIKTANVRKGNEKGTVEEAVKITRRQAFADKYRFESIEEAEAHLNHSMEKLNRNSLVKEERAFLKPLPPKYETASLVERKVNKYGFVSLNSISYSVPDHLVGRTVLVKEYDERIEIYCQGIQESVHKKPADGKTKTCAELTHFLHTLEQKPGALRNSAVLKSKPELKILFDLYFSAQPDEFIALVSKYQDLSEKQMAEQIRKHIESEKPEAIEKDDPSQKQILMIAEMFRQEAASVQR